MENWVYLLIGVAVLLVLFWVMSALTGLLFWGGLAAILGAIVVGLVRGWWREREARKRPGRLEQRRAKKARGRLLKDLEHETKHLGRETQERERLRKRS